MAEDDSIEVLTSIGCIEAETLDDLMRKVFQQILDHGIRVHATKGPNREISGVVLAITNARARLSSTETRGKPFSCLGELCWYLAASNDASFIKYYLKHYQADRDNHVTGGYGPRLFDWRNTSQVKNVTDLLKRKPHTRQAVIQLFDSDDIALERKDVPCTCTLQFFIRNDHLDMVTYMRSNDAFLGLPHDVFCFTMLQEIIARDIGVELGVYTHMVGSLHLYDKNEKAAQRFLREGWQSTANSMPPMPKDDPWPSVKILLDAEHRLRTTGSLDESCFNGLDPYWADLIRLLIAFRYKRNGEFDRIARVRDSMSIDLYFPFLDQISK